MLNTVIRLYRFRQVNQHQLLVIILKAFRGQRQILKHWDKVIKFKCLWLKKAIKESMLWFRCSSKTSCTLRLLGSDWIIDVWQSTVDSRTEEFITKYDVGRWNLVSAGRSQGAWPGVIYLLPPSLTSLCFLLSCHGLLLFSPFFLPCHPALESAQYELKLTQTMSSYFNL